MNTNSPKINYKKILAKEIIFITTLSVIFFSLYLLQSKLDENYLKNTEKITQLEKQIPPKQMLWYNLRKAELYRKKYRDFKSDYKETEDQIILFNLVKNNSLLPENYEEPEYDNNCEEIREFRRIVFYHDYTLDNCFRHFYNESYNLCPVNRSEWKASTGSKENFIEKLKLHTNIKKIYKSFLDNGYQRSIEDLKKVIFNPKEKELSDAELKRFESLKNENVKIYENYYHHKFINLYFIVFIVLFPFRYFISMIRWSIGQLRNKNNK